MMVRVKDGRGFSLVELLTVIAIISILAAIIFPVMTSVKDRANQTKCMTNLHNIQNAIKMYKLDNRTFPQTLGVQYQAGTPFDMANPGPEELTVYKDQIKTAAAYRCPSSPITDFKAKMTVTYPYPVMLPAGETEKLDLYAVDSYDAQASLADLQSGREVGASYTLGWAGSWQLVGQYQASPPGTPDTEALQRADYERQLRFKNPPEDTVITWCAYHKGDKALVLFLDGHVDNIPKRELLGSGTTFGSLWRTRPKRL